MPMNSNRILFATYVSPFPSNSGERIRAVNLINALKFLGYDVQAMVGNFDRVDLSRFDQERLRFHQIPFAWPRLRQQVAIYFSPNGDFLGQVGAMHRSDPFAAIILDYGFLGAQIAPLLKLGVPVVL